MRYLAPLLKESVVQTGKVVRNILQNILKKICQVNGVEIEISREKLFDFHIHYFYYFFIK
jgi:hypothetical protein